MRREHAKNAWPKPEYASCFSVFFSIFPKFRYFPVGNGIFPKFRYACSYVCIGNTYYQYAKILKKTEKKEETRKAPALAIFESPIHVVP